MCSYNSPTFLFQPIELLCLAGILRSWKAGEPFLLDAIAEQKSIQEVIAYIQEIHPDFIVTLTGFECFEEDMQAVSELKATFPQIPIVLFGHYATEFPELIMEKVPVDVILHGEPDMVFSEWLDTFSGKYDLSKIKGISYRKEGAVIHQRENSRIPNPNELPMPAFDLLKNDLYGEPFYPKPYGLIQSARGCPYQCNYCVKSFGTKLTSLTPENIILQVEEYIRLYDIRSFRFIDDTFTAVPQRVIEFCKQMIEKGHHRLIWSCLTRSDTLNREMLQWMKKAGCNRLYIGMESGSKKVLDFYNKRVDVEASLENIRYAKSLGFELMGFFMVGAPVETKAEVDESIDFAKKAGFDFIIVSELITYPGTPLFESLKDSIDFSLLPYKNEFKDSTHEQNTYELQKYFYRKFYMRPGKLAQLAMNKSSYLLSEFGQNVKQFSSYLFSNHTAKKRKDYV